MSVKLNAIGLDLAAKLCHSFAGKQIYIIKQKSNVGRFQDVIDCIGIVAAGMLQKELHGLVYIPTFRADAIDLRHQEIVDNYRGERVEDYALGTGLSSRHVYTILKDAGVPFTARPSRNKISSQVRS